MANLTENLKDSMTATFPREFDIPNAMTIQEIYDKLDARAAAFQMPFSVKGGIPGERVVFEKEPNLDVTLWLHVKNGTHIKITPVTQDSSAKINGIDVGKNSVMRKGVKGVASRPLLQGQYIDGVTDTIKKILADETVPDYVAPAVMPGADKPLNWLTLLLLCIFVGGAASTASMRARSARAFSISSPAACSGSAGSSTSSRSPPENSRIRTATSFKRHNAAAASADHGTTGSMIRRSL